MTADLSPIDLAAEPDFEVGGLAVRPSRREVAGGAGREILEPRMLQVLVALVRRRDQVVSRDELIATCWGGRIVGDDAINRCIAKLRRVGEAHHAFAIETIPRVGYRLAATGLEPAPAPAPRRRWIPPAALVLLVGAIGLGLWFAKVAQDRRLAWEEPRSAVLPFKALSGDAASRTFAAAADSEITGWLNEDHLQTLPPTRARHAQFVVSGTVQGDGARLRARVKVEDPRAGLAIWSGEFERPAAEAAALQSEIGFRVAGLMRSAADARRHSRGRVSPAALALYVQSRDTILLAPERSLALAEQLVREAPDFAPGHAALCQGLMSSARAASLHEIGPLRDRALPECWRALDLDPHFALPYLVLAHSEPGRNWAKREGHLRRGQALAAGPDPDFGLGNHLRFVGRLEEGVRLLRRSVAVRPSWTIPALNLASGLHGSGRTEEAQTFIARQLSLRPDDGHLRSVNFEIVAFSRPPEEGLAILADSRRRPLRELSGSVEPFRAFLIARRSGAAGDRNAAVDAILAHADASRLSWSDAIRMLSRLGALDAAFDQANAYADHPRNLRLAFSLQPDFLFEPETAAMRADPRFIPLVRRLGLLDYWRASGHWPDFCMREPNSVCAEMRHGGK